jgi:hypothetical protein
MRMATSFGGHFGVHQRQRKGPSPPEQSATIARGNVQARAKNVHHRQRNARAGWAYGPMHPWCFCTPRNSRGKGSREEGKAALGLPHGAAMRSTPLAMLAGEEPAARGSAPYGLLAQGFDPAALRGLLPVPGRRAPRNHQPASGGPNKRREGWTTTLTWWGSRCGDPKLTVMFFQMFQKHQGCIGAYDHTLPSLFCLAPVSLLSLRCPAFITPGVSHWTSMHAAAPRSCRSNCLMKPDQLADRRRMLLAGD